MKSYLDSLGAMLDASGEMQRLITPLYKELGIHGYYYFLVYGSGETLYLSNSREMNEKFFQVYQNKQQHFSITNYLSIYPNFGSYLLRAYPSIQEQRDPVLQTLSLEYDHYHELMMIEQIKTAKGPALRLCLYAAPKAQEQVNYYYLNQPTLLRKINHYFANHLESTIKKIPLIQPTHEEYTASQKQFKRLNASMKLTNKALSSCVREMGLHYPKYDQLKNVKLSQREKEIVHWYLMGKSASDTAKILKITPGTVRYYFENLKHKLGCYSKAQLPLKLMDGEFITPEDWQDIY